jgi:steroid delta-isomerase-like uncharacterized protein
MTVPTGTSAADVARAYLDALNDHDLDRAAAHWHPDVVEDYVVIGEFHGPVANRAFLEELLAAAPDFRLGIDRIVGDDSHAVVQWRATGTFTGDPFQGIHATGRPIDLRGVDVMHVVDGHLKHNTVYYDGLTFARQVGLLPAVRTLGDKAILGAFNAKTDVVKRLSTVRSKGRSPGA